VSVVLPTYNRAGTLARAIDSVLEQDFRDLELIVIDDASTDDTRERVAACADPRLRLLMLARNAGASAARNRGVAAARGALIAFQDSDDEWLPGRLRTQVDLLERLGERVVAVTGAILRPRARGAAYRGDWGVVPGPDGQRDVTYETIATQLWAQLQSLLVRRSAFLGAGGFDESLHGGEDWDFALRLTGIGRIVDCGALVAHLHYSPDSLTHRSDLGAPAMAALLDKHGARLPAGIAAQLARMSATRFILDGQVAPARAQLERALQLRPEDRGARLLSVLLRHVPWLAAPGIRAARRLRQ
jgi:glycosyltransferase involved in cell wall biosynthesis